MVEAERQSWRSLLLPLLWPPLLLRKGDPGHVVVADPEEQNKEVEVRSWQTHRKLEDLGRIPLEEEEGLGRSSQGEVLEGTSR